MPTVPGVPMPMLPGGPLNPWDWLSIDQNDFAGAQAQSLQRGKPLTMAPYQRRQVEGPGTVPQAAPLMLQSRPYDRGAGAYAPKFGALSYNPIGAGVFAPYRHPTIAGPGARYAFGAIFFDVQTVPTSVRASPSMSMQSLDALIATSHVGAMYATTG